MSCTILSHRQAFRAVTWLNARFLSGITTNNALSQTPELSIAHGLRTRQGGVSSAKTTGTSGILEPVGLLKAQLDSTQCPTSPSDRVRPKKRKGGPSGNQSSKEEVPQVPADLKVATQHDYPTVSKELFVQPALAWKTVTGAAVKFEEKFDRAESKWNVTVTAEIPGNRSEVGVACHHRKDEAKKAAGLQFINKIHTSGILQEFFLTADESKEEQTVDARDDAVNDVYNYSARSLAVPKLKVRQLLPSRKGWKPTIHVSLDLPEQNIHVEGRGSTCSTALAVASARFRHVVEQKYANGEEENSGENLSGLTVDNAPHFIEFCQNNQQNFSFSIHIQPVARMKGHANQPQAARAILNDEPLSDSVIMPTRKVAEKVAYLAAAVKLALRLPKTLSRFRSAKKTIDGRTLPTVPALTLKLTPHASVVMQEATTEASNALAARVQSETGEDSETLTRHFRFAMDPRTAKYRSETLRTRYMNFMQDSSLKDLREKKAQLPMNEYRTKVLNLVKGSSYSIIVGATGSGKTTQVPQILLEDSILEGHGAETNIICTQPRRMAATSVARRVAVERNEPLQDTVGYRVRFDSRPPRPGGSITYCTTGILLNLLQQIPDQVLNATSHIIIDEVHERDMLVDFLMITIKRVMEARRAAMKSTPKVVLMSATVDTDMFANYFAEPDGQGMTNPCPSLSVPGRTYAVKTKYLDELAQELRATYSQNDLRKLMQEPMTEKYLASEDEFKKGLTNTVSSNTLTVTNLSSKAQFDWTGDQDASSGNEAAFLAEQTASLVPYGLIAATVSHIVKTTANGAILVFLPGLEEIVAVRDILLTNPLGVDFEDKSKFRLVLLHSSIQQAQEEVFDSVPQGCRKIILSTNIAETSVTITDIQYVVDSGKLREKRYDQMSRITRLQCTWISKSNSKQRAGRAGRVQNGNYYALFSPARYESLETVGLPELLRSDLQDICLDIKAQALSAPIAEFLSEAIQPPLPAAVDVAIKGLKFLEALTESEQLTPLGKLLATLPVHPQLGKMILLGIIFRCLDPMLILGAAFNERRLLVRPLGAEKQADAARTQFSCNSNSDQIALIVAFRAARRIRHEKGEVEFEAFARRYFLHIGAFKTIDRTVNQIEKVLIEVGLIPGKPVGGRVAAQAGDPSLNKNAMNVKLIKALAVAGFRPNIAATTGHRTLRTASERDATIHSFSVNQTIRRQGHVSVPSGTLYAYGAVSQAGGQKRVSLRETSLVSPLIASLFAGQLAYQDHFIVAVDGWLPFYVYSPRNEAAAQNLVEFKEALDKILSYAFAYLSKRRAEEGRFLADDPVRDRFANAVVELLATDTYQEPTLVS